ncbi:MAG: helix-turn-helix domain-containing protein [Thermomicrobiales bacterium]
MSALDEDYLTVTEAAALLRVAPSTIRRWIREGDVPAYRLGRRRVALRRRDLSLLITPARSSVEQEQDEAEIERIKRRKLTPEEVQRGLEAMDRAERHAKELLAQRGGVPFPDSVDIIHEMREERTRQLMEALGWDDLR